MTTMTTQRPAYVLVDGPYANVNRDGDEYPEYTVSLMTTDDDEIKTYTCRSLTRALALGEQIAKDRRIGLTVDSIR